MELEVDLHENGIIISDIINIEGKQFMLMPVEINETFVNSTNENRNAIDILQKKSDENVEIDLGSR